MQGVPCMYALDVAVSIEESLGFHLHLLLQAKQSQSPQAAAALTQLDRFASFFLSRVLQTLNYRFNNGWC